MSGARSRRLPWTESELGRNSQEQLRCASIVRFAADAIQSCAAAHRAFGANRAITAQGPVQVAGNTASQFWNVPDSVAFL